MKEANYCQKYGERLCDDDEKLLVMDVHDPDPHEEERTVAEFIKFCESGCADQRCEWTSEGAGKYLVDERFCPRAMENELRYNLIGDRVIEVIHKKQEEEESLEGGGTKFMCTVHGPEEPQFASLTQNLWEDLPNVMASLGLAEEPLPLWWTIGFIDAAPHGSKDEKWSVLDFTPCADLISYGDIEENEVKAKELGNRMGEKALAILTK